MSATRQQRYLATRKATLIGASANIILAITKVLFGWLGHSSALMADGIHSFSDLLTDFLVILAAKFSHHEADEDHPYGHERIETAATVALSVLLMVVGLAIIIDAVHQLWFHVSSHKPDTYVLWIAVFSVIVNEGIYHYTKAVAKRVKSDMLYANALHSRSDAASSLVVLVGVGGSLLGIAWLDAAAAIVVGAMIIKMGATIGWQNIRELVDTGVDEAVLESIRQHILNVPGIQAIHQLRTRKMAGHILIDVHVIVPPYISVSEGHHIGDQVLVTLYREVDNVQDVTVHVDSEDDELYSQSASLPVRSQLLPLLKATWCDLPGVNAIKDVTLHYLEGKIEVLVTLPLSVLQSGQTAQDLQEAYQQAVADMAEIKQIKLLFTEA